MKQVFRLTASVLLACAVLATCAEAVMIIESLEGEVTKQEIQAFKDHMRTVRLPVDNKGNAMVYGSGGEAVEALGDMYEVSRDPEILDLMITFTDRLLAGRNDPTSGRILWTGRKELAWPNKEASSPESKYSGTENGDVLAHIAYTAKLILENKSLWNVKVGIGDPNGYGATYLERAKTYVHESDKTIDTFILTWFVKKDTKRYYFPDSELYAALGPRYANNCNKPVPWNQQMMLNGGFQRLAECHELLGDDPDRVGRYDAIVKASVDWFLSDVTKYQVNGRDCYKWSYGPEGGTLKHVEDTGHSGYDILIYRAYAGNRYGISKAAILPFANTAAFVLSKGNNQFAWRVDGSDKLRNYLPGSWLYLSDLLPELYPLIANADLERAKTRPEIAARLLWVKHNRNTGRFPTNKAPD